MKGIKKREGGIPVGRRAMSAVAAFILAILLVSETIVMVSYVVPTLAILLFQYGQIDLNQLVVIGEFAVKDAVILGMLWGAPTLVMCGLAVLVQWQVMKRGCRAIWRFVLASIGKGEAEGGRKGE